MPGGIHLIIGLILAYLLQLLYLWLHKLNMRAHKLQQQPSAHRRRGVRLLRSMTRSAQLLITGCVFGSIIPDIDLPLSIIYMVLRVLLLREDLHTALENSVNKYHRSVTHSLVLIVPALIITSLYVYYQVISADDSDDEKGIVIAKKQGGASPIQTLPTAPTVASTPLSADSKTVFSDYFDSGASYTTAQGSQHVEKSWLSVISSALRDAAVTCFTSSHFWQACFLGMLVHVALDLIYLKGARIAWPLSMHEYFFEVPMLGLYAFEKYSTEVQVLFMTFDALSEGLFYTLVLMGASDNFSQINAEAAVAASLNEPETSKAFAQESLLFAKRSRNVQVRMTRDHVVYSVFRALSIFEFSIILVLYLFLWRSRILGFDFYIVAIHFPATFFITVSKVAPLILTDAFDEWTLGNVHKAAAKRYRKLGKLVRRRTALASRAQQVDSKVANGHLESVMVTNGNLAAPGQDSVSSFESAVTVAVGGDAGLIARVTTSAAP